MPRGGAEISILRLQTLLREHGHEVNLWGMSHPDNQSSQWEKYYVSNVNYNNKLTFSGKIRAASKLLYSFEAKNKIDKLLEQIQPDLVHLNNFAHQISPSILSVIKNHSIPSVMAVRDYKLICPNYMLFTKGNICEKCKGKRFYHCIYNKCTKDSYAKSALSSFEMCLHHRILKLYDKIDCFYTVSNFTRKKIIEMGFPHPMEVIHNFVDAQKIEPKFSWEEKSIVYFGRLSKEKGLLTLIEAMKNTSLTLKIIGEGPFKPVLLKKIEKTPKAKVIFKGFKYGEELWNEIRKSMFVVFPSEWYEPFGNVAIEAFTLGKPVVAANIGGIPEIVENNKTGLLFKPGDSSDLTKCIQTLENSPTRIKEMGKNARKVVLEKFNPANYYNRLMEIYEIAGRNFR